MEREGGRAGGEGERGGEKKGTGEKTKLRQGRRKEGKRDKSGDGDRYAYVREESLQHIWASEANPPSRTTGTIFSYI